MNILDDLASGADVVKKVGETLDRETGTCEEGLERTMEILKAERELRLQEAQMALQRDLAQAEINKEEARSGNWFVAGWRPAIGWIGAAALAYQFVIYPVLAWLPFSPPEPLDAELLWTIVAGMLGLGGMRSFDKLQKTDTKAVK